MAGPAAPGYEWVKARDLKVGDQVATGAGTIHTVKRIDIDKARGFVTTYEDSSGMESVSWHGGIEEVQVKTGMRKGAARWVADGLVWQDGPYGEKIVGEIHRTGQSFKVVMTGLAVAQRVPSFEEAEKIALAWNPEPGDDTLNKILDPRYQAMRKGAPFAGYEDFDACVAANQDKADPEAYCGSIKHQVEGQRRTAGYAVTVQTRKIGEYWSEVESFTGPEWTPELRRAAAEKAAELVGSPTEDTTRNLIAGLTVLNQEGQSYRIVENFGYEGRARTARLPQSWYEIGAADRRASTPWARAPLTYEAYEAQGKQMTSDLMAYWQGYNEATTWDRYERAASIHIGEGNPFTDGNPYSSDNNPLSSPDPASQSTVPMTTRPRQMPGGGDDMSGGLESLEPPEPAQDEEPELPTLTGSLLPLYCMSTGHRFASRLEPGMRCVCGRDDYEIDLGQWTAMEGDPPMGMMPNFTPPMGEIETSEQFSKPFEEQGPEGLQDQPWPDEGVAPEEEPSSEVMEVESKRHTGTRVDSHEQALAYLEEAFGGRVSEVRVGGAHSSDFIRLSQGVDDWMFSRYGDNPWRWGMVSTYGNNGFVYGDVADASGYVVPDDYQDALDAIFAGGARQAKSIRRQGGIYIVCPEHGDDGMYEDGEAWCTTRDEALDMDDPWVQKAIQCAYDGLREKGFTGAKTDGPKFVGRSRSTEPGVEGAIRERQVQYPDGRTAWVEEGSAEWDAASGAKEGSRKQSAYVRLLEDYDRLPAGEYEAMPGIGGASVQIPGTLGQIFVSSDLLEFIEDEAEQEEIHARLYDIEAAKVEAIMRDILQSNRANMTPHQARALARLTVKKYPVATVGGAPYWSPAADEAGREICGNCGHASSYHSRYGMQLPCTKVVGDIYVGNTCGCEEFQRP